MNLHEYELASDSNKCEKDGGHPVPFACVKDPGLTAQPFGKRSRPNDLPVTLLTFGSRAWLSVLVDQPVHWCLDTLHRHYKVHGQTIWLDASKGYR